MAEDTDKTAQPISDVQKPGKTAPSDSSRPVLVTNRPIMKDPMVVEGNQEKNEDGSPAEPKENLAVKGSSKNKIQPLATSPKPEPSVPEPKEARPDEPAVPEEAAEPTEVEKPEHKPVETDKSEPKKTDSETTDKPPKSKEPKTPIEDADIEEARKAEHDANLQKIVDAKTYYLPINSVEKRKTKRFIILGVLLSLVLVLLWLDVALDAGLVQLGGLHSLTHFFSS